MSGYVLGEGADGDLDAIWEYISQDSVDAAERWVDSMFEAFATVAASPGIGHRRKDLTTYPVLFWPVGNYLVIYREQAGLVEMVAVVHGARDMPSFLSKRM
ncbi:MAG: type II toxin-antitoxin system RelE/ParE family toxin [Acidobacteriales bacterium]|nr:type II toxin-antitoxin system RelE/ParE family toxin [Terriglobales bacterium]